jgi:hypothetical protein
MVSGDRGQHLSLVASSMTALLMILVQEVTAMANSNRRCINAPVLAAALIVLLSLASVSCTDSFESIPYAQCPTAFQDDAARNWLATSSKRYTEKILFVENDLYLGTTTGLLKYDRSEKLTLFKCRRASWDTFEDVMYDENGKAIWAYVSRNLRLLQLDDRGWHERPVPSLPEGKVYSREEAGAGFTGFNFGGDFYLQGVDYLWKWSPGSSSWTSVSLAADRCSEENPARDVKEGCLDLITATDDALSAIWRPDSSAREAAQGTWHLFNKEVSNTDIIAYRQGNAWRVLNPQGTAGLYFKNSFPAPKEVFLLTADSRIFTADKTGVREIESLGNIDGAAVTYEGRLLVCFAKLGIFEWQGSWIRRADLPYAVDYKKYFSVHVGAKGSTIVVGFNPPDEDENDWKTSPQGELWIIKEGQASRLF